MSDCINIVLGTLNFIKASRAKVYKNNNKFTPLIIAICIFYIIIDHLGH